MYPAVYARSTPDKPAYIMASTGRTMTYRELDQGSMQIARLLRSRGLQPGDALAIYLENHPRFLETCWAAQRSGLRYTTISSRLTAPEVEYIVKDCGARAFVTSAEKAEVATELTAALAEIQRFMFDRTINGYENLDQLAALQAAEPLEDEQEGVSMLYSSGTTGRPKGVQRPRTGDPMGTKPLNFDIFVDRYRVTADSIYLSPAPLYHAAPLGFNMSFLRMGATCIIMEHFDACEAMRLIEHYRITHSQWVPTMFVRMLKLPDEARARYDLSSLEVAVHAAAPCPIPIKEKMIDWWGPILEEYYAGTEGNGSTSITSAEWLAHKGSVGLPQTAEVHVLDDDGNELPPGKPGLIFFAGGGEFEYHNDPERTRASHNDRGWSTLGDIGYLDDEGFLYLTDRKAHMIIRGGVNVYPQEAENLLITHPKVLDAAVIGVPSDDFGEEVKGVVEVLPGVEPGPELEAELIAFCHEHLARYKSPASIDFDVELPRHATGKLYKRLIKDRYWGKKDTRIV